MTKELLKMLGVDFSETEDGKIRSLLLPLTPGEWCALCQREGSAYIGGCCAQTSYIQDLVNGIFRDGYADAQTFIQLRALLQHHEGFEDFDDPAVNWANALDYNYTSWEDWDGSELKDKSLPEIIAFAKEHWKAVLPWKKIALTWICCKDLLQPDKGERIAERTATPLRAATWTVHNSLFFISMDHLFDKTKEPTAQDKVNRNLLLINLWPSLKLIHDQFKDLSIGPVQGYAVVKKGTEDILENGYGATVYLTQKEAEAILSGLDKNSSLEGEIRPVKVSLENGVEFQGAV